MGRARSGISPPRAVSLVHRVLTCERECPPSRSPPGKECQVRKRHGQATADSPRRWGPRGGRSHRHPSVKAHSPPGGELPSVPRSTGGTPRACPGPGSAPSERAARAHIHEQEGGGRCPEVGTAPPRAACGAPTQALRHGNGRIRRGQLKWRETWGQIPTCHLCREVATAVNGPF